MANMRRRSATNMAATMPPERTALLVGGALSGRGGGSGVPEEVAIGSVDDDGARDGVGVAEIGT